MIQDYQKIERSIRNRRDTDTALVSYWVYLFLLSWITFGIYNFILIYKRLNRVDGFINRKKDYYEGVLGYSEGYAKKIGKEEIFHHELQDLRNLYKDTFGNTIKQLNPVLSLLLSIITFGIWYFVILYKLNKVWNDLQRFEQDFDEKLSILWTKLGLIKFPFSFKLNQSKK